MVVRGWCDHKVVFFGGKGGVGKTTTAAAFSLLASGTGRRVLLVSTDPAHSTSDILEHSIGPRAGRVSDSLWAMEIDAEREASDYIERVRRHLLEVTPVRLRAEMERQMELARASPGAEEAALFDRIADLVVAVGEDFDTVVFDTAPTGHTLRMLALPEMLQAWVDGLLQKRRAVRDLNAMWRHMTDGGGPDDAADDPVEKVLLERRRKFYRMRRILLTPGEAAFVFVLIAERLPIAETRKAVSVLRTTGIPIGGLVINRVLPAEVCEHPFFAARYQREVAYLAEIDREFAYLPRIRVPLLDRDVVGRESLARIVEALEAGGP
jgi:arsenite-transporting ATPase